MKPPKGGGRGQSFKNTEMIGKGQKMHMKQLYQTNKAKQTVDKSQIKIKHETTKNWFNWSEIHVT